jgi:hypothetical protein
MGFLDCPACALRPVTLLPDRLGQRHRLDSAALTIANIRVPADSQFLLQTPGFEQNRVRVNGLGRMHFLREATMPFLLLSLKAIRSIDMPGALCYHSCLILCFILLF